MHELTPGAHVEGRIEYHGIDLYAPDIDPVAVRRTIGMVFQQPNPFPTMSIYDNVAAPARFNGLVRGKKAEAELVERCLRQAALWDEVKDKLRAGGTSLSGGQQQRLCIARALALEPDVLLMDEPCSALDPIATLQVEQLMRELKRDYTIVIVTHNMQQASRVSDQTAFLTMGDDRLGVPCRDGRHGRDLHQPQGPADRGLRLRPVRLSSDGSDERPDRDRGRRPWTRRSSDLMDEAETATTRQGPPREALDRDEELIRDAVLRMGALVETAIREASRTLVGPRRRAGARGHQGRRDHQRGAARGLAADLGHDRDPAAGRPRPALPADPRPRHLRARADGRPRRVGRQGRHQAGARAAAEGYIHLPEMAERAAMLVHGVLLALVESDAVKAREIAVQDDEIDRLYHATFDRVVDLMREDPANVERGTRIIIASHYLERIGDRATNIAEDVVYLVTGDVEDLNP